MAGTDPESFTTFGELLKYLRRRARMTQRELGIAVGYSDAQITRLETGQRLPDPAAVCANFFDALGLAPDAAEARQLLALAEQAQAGSSVVAAPPRVVPPTNLPAPLTRLFGREDALAQVQALLERGRLVTLTGTGGVGKTSLALEVGRAAQDGNDFSNGVWLGELVPISEPELVPSLLLGVFGLTTMTRSAREALIDHLRGLHLLLIVDNCEHIIAACAELVEALLRACPGLKVLATSREGLNIPGEVTWLVPPPRP